MDAEFYALLRAVRDGGIQDTARIRRILADARTAVEAKEDAVRDMQTALFEAERAFISGWDSEVSQ